MLTKVIGFYTAHDLNHEFVLNLPAGVEHVEFMIDRHRIQQVLENLLNNAGKYSPKGTRINLTCRYGNAMWQVSVVDQGIGMTPEQIGHVFDKFYRADSSNTAVSGFGLGMSIAKQIIELHGGSIHVQSEPGIGTNVTFTLPDPID